MNHPLYFSAKKQIADENGRGDAGKISDQSAGDGMPGFFNAHGTEIDGQHIKGGFSTALHDGHHF